MKEAVERGADMELRTVSSYLLSLLVKDLTEKGILQGTLPREDDEES